MEIEIVMHRSGIARLHCQGIFGRLQNQACFAITGRWKKGMEQEQTEWGSLTDRLQHLAQTFTPLTSSSSSPSPLSQILRHYHGDGEGQGNDYGNGALMSNVSKKAAVLVCLFKGANGEVRVILTRRSDKLSTHSGEVALPGGKMEENDKDDIETALREAKEEIGLDPSHVKIVTTMEPVLSKHLLAVTPVVGLLHDINTFKPILNASEVDAVFDAPLEMFLKNENYWAEEREWMNVKFTVHFFEYHADKKKFLIWGLTASVLVHVASIIYQRQPSFPEILPDFSQTVKASGEH